MADHVDTARRSDALERVHAAAHGLVRHVDAAQTRMTLRVVQHAVIGQLVLFDALDDVHDHVVAAQLVQPVEKAAHAQVMRRKLAVARNDEDLAALRIGRDQSRRDAARLYHILTDVIQAAALADIRVAGHDRHAGGDQTVDLLAHDERVGRGDDQAVDAALLHAADRLEVRARRTVLQLLDQHGHVVQAAVVHRGADAVAHAADEERIPARQDDADAVHAAARPGRLPLRRCFVAVFADQLLNALAHLGRDVRTAVYHAVYRSARYATLIRDPLCSYLHSRILPFTLSCIFLFTARNHGELCILVHDCTVYSIIPDKASQAILCILDTVREFVAFGCAFFVFAQRTAFLHVFARDFLHFSPNRHAKIGRYAKNEIPT